MVLTGGLGHLPRWGTQKGRVADVVQGGALGNPPCPPPGSQGGRHDLGCQRSRASDAARMQPAGDLCKYLACGVLAPCGSICSAPASAGRALSIKLWRSIQAMRRRGLTLDLLETATSAQKPSPKLLAILKLWRAIQAMRRRGTTLDLLEAATSAHKPSPKLLAI